MPHPNLPPELIFAGSIWLTAIVIFLIMLIAVFASLRSTDKTEAKSVDARFHSKRKTKDRS